MLEFDSRCERGEWTMRWPLSMARLAYIAITIHWNLLWMHNDVRIVIIDAMYYEFVAWMQRDTWPRSGVASEFLPWMCGSWNWLRTDLKWTFCYALASWLSARHKLSCFGYGQLLMFAVVVIYLAYIDIDSMAGQKMLQRERVVSWQRAGHRPDISQANFFKLRRSKGWMHLR